MFEAAREPAPTCVDGEVSRFRSLWGRRLSQYPLKGQPQRRMDAIIFHGVRLLHLGRSPLLLARRGRLEIPYIVVYVPHLSRCAGCKNRRGSGGCGCGVEQQLS